MSCCPVRQSLNCKVSKSKPPLRMSNMECHKAQFFPPVLSLLYTAPVADIIKRFDLDYHIYADDTQLYVSAMVILNW